MAASSASLCGRRSSQSATSAVFANQPRRPGMVYMRTGKRPRRRARAKESVLLYPSRRAVSAGHSTAPYSALAVLQAADLHASLVWLRRGWSDSMSVTSPTRALDFIGVVFAFTWLNLGLVSTPAVGWPYPYLTFESQDECARLLAALGGLLGSWRLCSTAPACASWSACVCRKRMSASTAAKSSLRLEAGVRFWPEADPYVGRTWRAKAHFRPTADIAMASGHWVAGT